MLGGRVLGRVRRQEPERDLESRATGRVTRLIVESVPEVFDLPARMPKRPWIFAPSIPRAAIWHAFMTVTTAMEHLRLGLHHTAAMECSSDALDLLRFCGVKFSIEEDLA